MKKYIHKPTGKIYEKTRGEASAFYYIEGSFFGTAGIYPGAVDHNIVEAHGSQDWEEVEPEKTIEQRIRNLEDRFGILKMYIKNL